MSEQLSEGDKQAAKQAGARMEGAFEEGVRNGGDCSMLFQEWRNLPNNQVVDALDAMHSRNQANRNTDQTLPEMGFIKKSEQHVWIDFKGCKD